ncbi:hypothetical protein [Thiomicrorhabdus sp. 6S3-12]|nr:hypothetical protein [Thiomicrorhabdus sp. 6S3-12]MBO1924076.1 hypothetical protein [Thiomicrorhabdus sp. 6S3-12]
MQEKAGQIWQTAEIFLLIKSRRKLAFAAEKGTHKSQIQINKTDFAVS